MIQKSEVVCCSSTTQIDTTQQKDCFQKRFWRPVGVAETVSDMSQTFHNAAISKHQMLKTFLNHISHLHHLQYKKNIMVRLVV